MASFAFPQLQYPHIDTPLEVQTKAATLGDILQQRDVRNAQLQEYQAQTEQRNRDLADSSAVQQLMKDPVKAARIYSGDTTDLNGNVQPKTIDTIRKAQLDAQTSLLKNRVDQNQLASDSLGQIASTIQGLKTKADGTPASVDDINLAIPGAIDRLNKINAFANAGLPAPTITSIKDPSDLDQIAAHMGASKVLRDKVLAQQKSEQENQAKDVSNTSALTKAAGTELSNADSQPAWDAIIGKYPGAATTFGPVYSPDAAKRAGQFTISPQEKVTQQQKQSELDVELAKLAATGADPVLLAKLKDPQASDTDKQAAAAKIRDQIVDMKGREAAAAAMAPINAMMNVGGGQTSGQTPGATSATPPATGAIQIPKIAPGQKLPPGREAQYAFENNNPGNVVFAGQKGATPGGSGGYAKFDTPENGYAAIATQIQSGLKKNQNLTQYIEQYTRGTDPANVALYLKQTAQAVGAKPDTPLSQIDPTKLQQWQAWKESSTPIGGFGQPSAPQAATPIAPPPEMAPYLPKDVHEEVLAKVPPFFANQVRAISAGDAVLPPGGSQRNPVPNFIRGLLFQYEPTYDYTDPAARMKTKRDYQQGGDVGDKISAIDTALQHGSLLADAVDNLNNTSFPKYNSIANWVSKNTGSPEVKAFVNVRNKFADELAAAWRKNGGNEQDVKAEKDAIDAADSPQALRKVMADDVQLLQGRYEPLQRKFESTMRRPIGDLGLGQNAQNAAQKILGKNGQASNYKTPDAVWNLLSKPDIKPGIHTLSDGSKWMKSANGGITPQ